MKRQIRCSAKRDAFRKAVSEYEHGLETRAYNKAYAVDEATHASIAIIDFIDAVRSDWESKFTSDEWDELNSAYETLNKYVDIVTK